MYRIIGIIDSHHIVQIPEGFKKVKITGNDKKNVCDEIKIGRLYLLTKLFIFLQNYLILL